MGGAWPGGGRPVIRAAPARSGGGGTGMGDPTDGPLAPGERARVTRGPYRGRTVAIVRRVAGGGHAEAYEAVPEGDARSWWFGRRSLVRLPAPPPPADPRGAHGDA
jgi:hypothetical protein